MRLLDIKKSLNIATELFHPKYSNSGSTFYIDNIIDVKMAVRELYAIGLLTYKETSIDVFTIILSSMTDRLILDQNQHLAYKREFDKMEYTLKLMNDWINAYVPENETEDTINIKLPKLNNIEDLAKVCTIVNRSLSQLVAEIGGTIKFKQVDYGSTWISIAVGIPAAVSIILALANRALSVAKKYYELKTAASAYERFNMGTETMRKIKETNEKILEDELAKHAKEIEQGFYSDEDKERQGRIRVSLTEMRKLIELGGEVHPSLIYKEQKGEDIDYKQLSIFKEIAGLLPKEQEKTDSQNE